MGSVSAETSQHVFVLLWLQFASNTQNVLQTFFFMFRCEPNECVMIGDDVRDDVGGAINAGMKGILVQTGKYRNGDETTIDLPPECVARDFPHAVDLILSHR